MTMAMELIRHIAGLYGGKAIKGDITQVYITGNEIWMAQQVLAEQAEGAQGEQTSLRRALEQAYMALIGYLPAHRNAMTDAAIEAARAALAQPALVPELQGGLDVAVDRLEIPVSGWGHFPIVHVPWNVFDRAVMWVEDRRRYGDDGTIVDDWMALKAIQRAALAQPSPIRCQCCGYLVTDSEHRGCLRAARQRSPAPELEQPEVVAWMWRDLNGDMQFNYMHPEGEPLMTVAQHERICFAHMEVAHSRNVAMKQAQADARRYKAERDAAQAKLAAMEKQEPVAAVSEETFSSDGTSDIITRNLPIGTMLYAAPVAQAGQVPEGYMLITQDQVERHATTAWECPPQSRVVLVSTLKRLHEKNSAVPQPAGGE